MARGLTRSLARNMAREAGAAPGKAGMTAVTTGTGGTYKTVIRFNAMTLAVTDALAYASQQIFGCVAGYVRIKGGSGSLTFSVTTTRSSTINDNAALDWSVGTVAASSVTLASTMVDIIAKQDKTLDGVDAAYTTASTAAVAAAATHDGTTTAIRWFLNIGFPTTSEIDADGTLRINGTITVLWENWGDI